MIRILFCGVEGFFLVGETMGARLRLVPKITAVSSCNFLRSGYALAKVQREEVLFYRVKY